MDQPIACTLTSAEYADRTEAMARLAHGVLRSRRPIRDGERLTFASSAGTERDLLEIVAAEARCCAFLRMDLRRRDDELVLDITGPAEAAPIIAELFR